MSLGWSVGPFFSRGQATLELAVSVGKSPNRSRLDWRVSGLVFVQRCIKLSMVSINQMVPRWGKIGLGGEMEIGLCFSADWYICAGGCGVCVRVRGWVRDRDGFRVRGRVRGCVRVRAGVRIGLGLRLQLCEKKQVHGQNDELSTF